MQKKLQVFISSTYTDLKSERQTAVQAVLNAGHIPAGMELFKSGDQSQKETIQKWINESDIYLLILGGRYGSIDEESGKSYTHWEYDYALEKSKPHFAIVIKEEELEKRIKEHGLAVTEQALQPKYEAFRKQVLSKIIKFFTDEKDIKIAILESLKEHEQNEDLKGWISGQEIQNQTQLLSENYELLKQNKELLKQLSTMQQAEKTEEYQNILNKLENYYHVELPEDIIDKLKSIGEIEQDNPEIIINSLTLFHLYQQRLIIGIHTKKIDKETYYLIMNLIPNLMKYDLVRKIKLPEGKQRFEMTEKGLKFLIFYEEEKANHLVSHEQS
ncbi:DUF4062 domain-containing protein [Longirhabdus pacifica]|uniref:DUF4062 domain-containing protein n=1 Tax=Longirhabdus pacifica TaxID=2305227 RepID=UPI00100939DD|nr:DUF4062 domain-containing protein [Longirhabdus pacifica]